MELKISKRSTVNVRKEVKGSLIEWGTSLRPGPTFVWDKDESMRQATQVLLAKLFKGRVKNIRQYSERGQTLSLLTGEEVYFQDELIEVSSAGYIMAIRDIKGCNYKYKVHITDLKSGKIYNFTVKNGDIYHKDLGIGNQLEVIANFILTEPTRALIRH